MTQNTRPSSDAGAVPPGSGACRRRRTADARPRCDVSPLDDRGEFVVGSPFSHQSAFQPPTYRTAIRE